ncbi:MAG TPA: hypothetical protein VMM16_09005 [Verrucomicrobiae bacterium]|nr:hypothetical protein [Verrucomicrobiae bacterium]
MSASKENPLRIFIAKGHTQSWRFTWRHREWRGDTINPPRLLNNGAYLTYSLGSLAFHGNGTCSLCWSVTNHGPESAFFTVEPTCY